MTRYAILTSSVRMPGGCWCTYRRVAVVELKPGVDGTPWRSVRRIVAAWERLNTGTTAYAEALAEAQALVERLEQA